MRTVNASRFMEGINQVTGDDHMREHLITTTKRVIWVILVISILLLLVGGRNTIISWIDHPVSKVTLSGEFKNLSEQGLQKHLAPYIGVGFLNTDLKELKHYVEQMAWVQSATVKRVWPGEFDIRIDEQVPVSYWGETGLLNASGELFSPEELDRTMPLPMLKSPAGEDANLRLEMLSLLAYIQNELSVFNLQLIALEQGLRGDWVMQLDNGIRVVLGKVEKAKGELRSLDNKLERVGKLLMQDSLINADRVRSLDTRYPNGIAVEWIESSVDEKINQ